MLGKIPTTVKALVKQSLFLLFLCCLIPLQAALDIESRYSPLNSRRERRRSTQYIILHTTEGSTKGSLEKLRRRGEAHYLIAPSGKVYRIIDKSRVAFHAGRSMWNGRTNLDNTSIGIEMVGYHNKPLTAAQKTALKELLRQLQSIYKIPDEQVLSHSAVAYGSPNRWHKHAHRGRKRCGMLMMQDGLRKELGLTSRPLQDPDVRAGRLKVADPYLEKVLYAPQRFDPLPPPPILEEGEDMISRGRSAWDIARDAYNSPSTEYIFPSGVVKRGDEIRAWDQLPPGTRVKMNEASTESPGESERVQTIGKDGRTAADIAGSDANKASTIYFLKNGTVKTGSELNPDTLASLPDGTSLLVGYVHGGVISAQRSAFDICGPRWNLPTTFYRLKDGTIKAGDQMNEHNIPNQTMVFFQQ